MEIKLPPVREIDAELKRLAHALVEFMVSGPGLTADLDKVDHLEVTLGTHTVSVTKNKASDVHVQEGK